MHGRKYSIFKDVITSTAIFEQTNYLFKKKWLTIMERVYGVNH